MNKYQDSQTYYHDKPCVNGLPSSNNRNLYTAYSKYLAPRTIDMNKIRAAYSDCIVFRDPMIINRLPGKLTPPLSKDEVIGMTSLGLLSYHLLQRSFFNFCNYDFGERKLTILSTIKALFALYKIRKEHRNYVWENKVYDAYPLAFRLPPEDIYYVKTMNNVTPTLFEKIVFNLNMRNVIKSGDKSSRMMLWLKLKDIDHSMADELPIKSYVLDYFGKDHIFYQNIK